MSFWSENKGAFKAAGIATAKGIGHGTKSLSKAGYATYKKHEAKQKGLPPPEENSLNTSFSAQPPMEKAQLSSLPPPPKRNVPTYDTPGRGGQSHYSSSAGLTPNAEPTHVQKPPQQQQYAAQYVPPAQPAVPNPPSQIGQPPQYVQVHGQPQDTLQSPRVQQVQPQQAEAFQQPQQVQYQQVPQTHYVQVGVPAQEAQSTSKGAPPPVPPPRNASASPAGTSPSPAPGVAGARFGHFETTETGEQKYIPKPAPDASHFAAPPIHKGRNNGGEATPVLVNNPAVQTASSSPAVSTTGASAPLASNRNPATSSTGAEQVRKPVSFVDIDISKLGPPPPRIYRASDQKAQAAAPPTPARPVPSTPPASSVPPLATPVAPARSKPPKPAKLLAHLGAPQRSEPSDKAESPPPPYVEQDSGLRPAPPSRSPSRSTTQPNFAAEIASLRLQDSGVKEQPVIPPKPGTLAKPPRPSKPSFKNSTLPDGPAAGTHELGKVETGKVSPSKPVKPALPGRFGSNTATPPNPVSSTNSGETSVAELNAKSAPEKPVKPLKPSTIKHEFEIPIIRPSPASGGFFPSNDVTTGTLRSEVKQADSQEVNQDAKPVAKPEAKPETKPGAKPKPTPPKPLGLTVGTIPSPSPPPVKSGSPAEGLPPPPPARRAASSTGTTPPPAPPPRNYSRPAVSVPKVSTPNPEMDLELATRWYENTSSPLELPKALASLNYNSSYQYSVRGGTTEYTRNITVRLKDLSKVSYEITWVNDNPATATLKVDLPSPIENRVPTKAELVQFSQQFGEHIAAWCLHNEGKQVGSGECWDLAHDALAKGCGKHAFVSTYYHHGYPILELDSGAVAKGPEDEIRKGDILQFTSAKFENRANGSTQSAGDPNHTSVVIDKIGARVLVAEQNVQGVRKVVRGEYVLGHLTAGNVVVYRPMPAAWAE